MFWEILWKSTKAAYVATACELGPRARNRGADAPHAEEGFGWGGVSDGGGSSAAWLRNGRKERIMEERALRILAVDDDAAIADMVARMLEAECYDVTACYSGADALALFAENPYDLVLLDIMMPGIDGLEVCRQIRQVSEVPIVFLSAKDEETDKVLGLLMGADDYIVKPFRQRELVARVKARLRRLEASRSAAGLAEAAGADGATDGGAAGAGVRRVGDLEINERGHVVHFQGVEVPLAPKEFGVLAMLARNAGATVSAAQLYETVWEQAYDKTANNSVMVCIRGIRRKLAEVDSSMDVVYTVWGVGYKIEGAAEGVGR